jgi:hypothetical protein
MRKFDKPARPLACGPMLDYLEVGHRKRARKFSIGSIHVFQLRDAALILPANYV